MDYERHARFTFARAQPNVNLVTIKRGSHTGFASLFPELLMKLGAVLFRPPGSSADNPDTTSSWAMATTRRSPRADQARDDAVEAVA
jgi:hypothetical protein